MTLGTKLRNLRTAKNESLEVIALKLELSKTAIGKWEADKAKPSAENLLKICNHFETDVYKLLENVDNINFGNAKFKGNQYVIYPNNSTINYATSPEIIEVFINNHKTISELIEKQNDSIVRLLEKN